MKKIIIANWKMNDSDCAEKLVQNHEKWVKKNCNIMIAPPYIYLEKMHQLFQGSQFGLCAQNCSQFEGNGAYTGEISAQMLKNLGVDSVIIGHSERRQYYDETNEICRMKLYNAVNADICAVYCIGESLETKQRNQTISFLNQQIGDVFTNFLYKRARIIIAYEPIWAIGSGLTPTFNDINQIHTKIKDIMNMYLPNQPVAVLYGGSVNGKNAPDIMATPNVDGVLVGGASLLYDNFTQIIQST